MSPAPHRTVVDSDRFPGFDALAQRGLWDPVTTATVLSRLTPPPVQFFTAREAGTASALLDVLLGQEGPPRIPVLELIDQRLTVGDTDGWHHDDMPPDGVAWRASLACLDADARDRHEHDYATLTRDHQRQIICDLQDLSHRGGTWQGLSAAHVWNLWIRYACTGYYSHPWAWTEMGFPGPAYPRGYLNAGINAREQFEVADHGGQTQVSGDD